MLSFGCFFLDSACWSFHYLSYNRVPSLPLLALGFAYIDQGSATQFVGSRISFLDSLLFPGWLFWWMESINVAAVLQEAGNADLRAHTRSTSSCGFVFCSFTSSVHLFRWLEHDDCCVYFFVSFFSGPINLELLMHINCCVCCVKPFPKSGIWSLFYGFPWSKIWT